MTVAVEFFTGTGSEGYSVTVMPLPEYASNQDFPVMPSGVSPPTQSSPPGSVA